MDIQTVKQIINTHNGIIKSKETFDSKIYYHFLKKLIDEGYVEEFLVWLLPMAE